jgi:hypothetical protein
MRSLPCAQVTLTGALVGPLLVAVPAILLGCATTAGQDLARARAAREYNCPPQRISVKWLSTADSHNAYVGNSDVYRVSACGIIATYLCNEDLESCTKESDDRQAPR